MPNLQTKFLKFVNFVRKQQEGMVSFDRYGDGTGWNLNGMMNEKSDAASDFFMQNMFPKIKEYAETFAGQHLKADLARIDFFINTENGDVKLNEVETVSGNWSRRAAAGC